MQCNICSQEIVDNFLHHVARDFRRRKGYKSKHSQLQQCPVGIAVTVLVLALLLKVGLKSADSLRIVALEAVDNVDNVVGPLGRVFAVHGRGCDMRSKGCREEVRDGGARRFRRLCEVVRCRGVGCLFFRSSSEVSKYQQFVILSTCLSRVTCLRVASLVIE